MPSARTASLITSMRPTIPMSVNVPFASLRAGGGRWGRGGGASLAEPVELRSGNAPAQFLAVLLIACDDSIPAPACEHRGCVFGDGEPCAGLFLPMTVIAPVILSTAFALRVPVRDRPTVQASDFRLRGALAAPAGAGAFCRERCSRLWRAVAC